MNQNTPGPWFNVDHTEIRADYPNQNGTHVATIWAHGCDQTKANARLIAAAPDLLAALETRLPVAASAYGAMTNDLDAARAAIAKARGKA